jgi:hypothetical protein
MAINFNSDVFIISESGDLFFANLKSETDFTCVMCDPPLPIEFGARWVSFNQMGDCLLVGGTSGVAVIHLVKKNAYQLANVLM